MTSSASRGPRLPSVAPYIDVTLTEAPDVRPALAAGVRTVTLGFVTAMFGRCQPAWGGSLALTAPPVAALADTLRSQHGDVRISFGGNEGTELASACSDPRALAAAYQQAVDALRATRIDLDVEGAGLDPTVVHRRNAALAILLAAANEAGHPVEVSYTLPADAAGLAPEAAAVLRDARDAGLPVDVVNAMAMDYGGGVSDMGNQALTVATSTKDLVRSLWPQFRDDQAWAKVAVTAMIGLNDVPGEVFGLDDARTVARFARQHGLAWVSFWSLDRDRPCPRQFPGASDSCSGITQQPGAFTAAFTRS